MMKRLTLDQVKHLYGALPLKFLSYFKYIFTFSGEDKDRGIRLEVCIGGDADLIYQAGVDRDHEVFLGNLNWISIIVEEKGKVIFREGR